MRNYKINSIIDGNSYFGISTFNEEQIKILEDLLFNYVSLPLFGWEKYYSYDPPYGSLKMYVIPSGEFLQFYHGQRLLPCELQRHVGKDYKKVMKILSGDIKKLKEFKIIG